MKLSKPNWYGLDHSAVPTLFEGNPRHLNDFCVKGEYEPCAVYYVAKPNKRKKHKTYMLLSKVNGQFYVRGMSPREMNKYRYQAAIHCLSCDEVVYSVNRHHMNYCSCGGVGIDGGKDYTKAIYGPNASYDHVTLDLITDTITTS